MKRRSVILNVIFGPLLHLFLDEVEDQVNEFIHSINQLLFDSGKVIRFGFTVVVAVFGAGFTPGTGIERFDETCGSDEFERVDDAVVIYPALPKFVK